MWTHFGPDLTSLGLGANRTSWVLTALAEIVYSRMQTGFFPYVDSLVRLQIAQLREGPVTMFTEERFLSCVDSLVRLQMAQLSESLVTPFTDERFLSAVDAMMQPQVN